MSKKTVSFKQVTDYIKDKEGITFTVLIKQLGLTRNQFNSMRLNRTHPTDAIYSRTETCYPGVLTMFESKEDIFSLNYPKITDNALINSLNEIIKTKDELLKMKDEKIKNLEKEIKAAEEVIQDQLKKLYTAEEVREKYYEELAKMKKEEEE